MNSFTCSNGRACCVGHDMRLYRYVGPKHIAQRVQPAHSGVPIRSPEDVRAWIHSSRQESSDGRVIATFIVDAAGTLFVADRRSEHVACAAGQPVRSAGEMPSSRATPSK